MSRAVLAAFAACFLVLAGCIGASTPREPTADHAPWTDASGPWIVLSDGCGFCGPSQRDVQTALVLYKTGQVMQFSYGVALGEGALVAPENFTEEIQEIIDYADLHWESNHTIVVGNVTTSHLGASTASIHRVLETGLRFARDPGSPDLNGTADALPTKITAPSWNVELFGDYDGTAWADIQEQLRLVQAWLHE